MSGTLTVDGLTYELRRSERRKTLGITVDRDGSLILTAPEDCSEETIKQTARKKELWVRTKTLHLNSILYRPCTKIPSKRLIFVQVGTLHNKLDGRSRRASPDGGRTGCGKIARKAANARWEKWRQERQQEESS